MTTTASFYGWVEGIEDVVTFEADNLADLEREFRISVDDYFALCARNGVAPEKPQNEQEASLLTLIHRRVKP